MRRPRGPVTADDGWTSETSSGFALAGFLTVVFAGLTLLAMGPLSRFDTYFNLAPPPPSWLPVLHVVDRVGQRAICVPILGAVALYLSRKQESWRPVVVAGAAVFFLNLVVLILKVGLGRDAPASADPSFFTGGMAYPSGHSSNVVLVYGMIAYVILAYGHPGRRARILLWAMVPALSVVMVVTSLTLNWHWFSDLISGLLIGGVILQLAVAADHAVPDVSLEGGWRRGLAEAWQTLRGRRSRGSASPS